MFEALTIFQCGDCLRYFRMPPPESSVQTAFVLLVPQPVCGFGVPEVCACGLPDCRAVARARAEEIRRIDDQYCREVALRRRAQKEECRRKNAEKKAAGSRRRVVADASHLAASNACHRGMPPEREGAVSSKFQVPSSKVESLVVGSAQKEFHGAVDVAPALKKLLAFFEAHFGEWQALPVLESVCGHHAVNSRCSELRELIRGDQDIDQVSRWYEPTQRAHSHYRLCLKSESVRLKRRVEKEEGQLTADYADEG